MIQRVAFGLFTVLLLLVQARLWISDDGFREVARLRALQQEQTEENARLTERNRRLEAEVRELKNGQGAVEERARADLGLIDSGETFYLFGGRPDARDAAAGERDSMRQDFRSGARPGSRADLSEAAPRG